MSCVGNRTVASRLPPTVFVKRHTWGPKKRGMSGRANLYRVHAAECMKVAQTAHDLEDKQAFLDMATAWLILAEQADKNSEEHSANSRAVQQQQQPQPDDSKHEE